MLLRPLKTKKDTAMPTKKADLLLRYGAWTDRPLPAMPSTTPIVNNDTEEAGMSDAEDNAMDEDVIDAKLALHQTVHVRA